MESGYMITTPCDEMYFENKLRNAIVQYCESETDSYYSGEAELADVERIFGQAKSLVKSGKAVLFDGVVFLHASENITDAIEIAMDFGFQQI